MTWNFGCRSYYQELDGMHMNDMGMLTESNYLSESCISAGQDGLEALVWVDFCPDPAPTARLPPTKGEAATLKTSESESGPRVRPSETLETDSESGSASEPFNKGAGAANRVRVTDSESEDLEWATSAASLWAM